MRCPVTFTGPAVALWAVTVSRPGGRGTGRTAGPCRGRSGLHRAGCWLTASRGDPQDSATERKPPMAGLRVRTGKGETVRQERTSDGGDPVGSVNPTRSKAKRGKRAARPPPEREGSPGRPLRWMATQAPPGAGQNPAYRPAHRQTCWTRLAPGDPRPPARVLARGPTGAVATLVTSDCSTRLERWRQALLLLAGLPPAVDEEQEGHG